VGVHSANYFSGGNTNASLLVFNGSASMANVSVHFLNKDGSNLAGVNVPGATPPMVGSNIEFSGFHPVRCSLLPK
jgi:hypothetical protein